MDRYIDMPIRRHIQDEISPRNNAKSQPSFTDHLAGLSKFNGFTNGGHHDEALQNLQNGKSPSKVTYHT